MKKTKNVPQLRFTGFKKIENEKLKDENWFSAPASEIFISVNDRNHPELPVLSASQELGMIYRDEGGMNIFHDVANEITYKRVKPGQFVIHLRSFQGGFAHSKVEGITSPAYTILDFKDRNKHNDLFWKYVLTSDEFIKRLELITYGIRDGRSINFSDFSTLKFHFPSYEVQHKIGAFLSHVDSLIQAKTKKLESLKAVKKSLLQKCFPKAGQKVPEMRFAGFSGDWEYKEFKDITVSSGKKNKDNEPYVSYSITNENGFVLQDEKFENGGTMKDADKSMYWIVSPKSFAYNPARINVGSIGYQNLEEDVIVSSLYEIFKTSEDCCDEFLWHWFKSEHFNKLIQKLQEGGVRLYFYYDKLCMCGLLMPTLAEQQKIGQFFSKYDSLISAQQKEIDKLKDIKKSLLQKMFI